MNRTNLPEPAVEPGTWATLRVEGRDKDVFVVRVYSEAGLDKARLIDRYSRPLTVYLDQLRTK
jgi:hypothetical protein